MIPREGVSVSIRLKIFMGCLAMLCVTVGLGLFGHRQSETLGALAIDVYEHSLMGISYTRSAQVGFIRLPPRAATDNAASERKRRSALKDVLDDLDVALQRIAAPNSLQQTRELRGLVASGGADVSDIGD